MKKYTIFALIFALVTALAVSGCPKKDSGGRDDDDDDEKEKPAAVEQAKSPIEEATLLLEEQGIDASTLKKDDFGNWSITVETSEMMEYDAQLLSTWGMIFGTLAWYANDHVTITNTLAGEPVMRIVAKVDDILDFQRGVTTEDEFFMSWEYEHAE